MEYDMLLLPIANSAVTQFFVGATNCKKKEGIFAHPNREQVNLLCGFMAGTKKP
jgi:hypothetical protein